MIKEFIYIFSEVIGVIYSYKIVVGVQTGRLSNIAVAIWTSWFFGEPPVDTWFVEGMLADWHLPDFLFFGEVVTTDGAYILQQTLISF